MGHDHSRHHQAHGHAPATLPVLRLALLITLGFAGVEALAGWWSGSLTLLADAGHMLTDAASLGLAGLAAWLGARPPSRWHSYGLGRAEALAALVNATAMLVLVALIAAEAWARLQAPRAVDGLTVTVVALLGLLVNLYIAWQLSRTERDLNVRGALLHVLGDALGSIAAIVSGVVIWASGWTLIDPLLSLLVALLILGSSLRLIRESLHALLDGVPLALPLEQVGHALARVTGVTEVHDLHIWSLSSRRIALSAHVTIEDLAQWPQVLMALREAAHGLGIEHATFQPELAAIPLRWAPRRAASAEG